MARAAAAAKSSATPDAFNVPSVGWPELLGQPVLANGYRTVEDKWLFGSTEHTAWPGLGSGLRSS